MNIQELREEFKEASGFIFWENSELDKAINRGIRYLDSICFSSRREQRIFLALVAGESSIVFPQKCQVIKEVWINSMEMRKPLAKVSLEEIRNPNSSFYKFWYGGYDSSDIVSNTTSGIPNFYTPFVTETFEKTIDKMEVISKFADITFTDGSYRGIALSPIADMDYIVEIFGRFYSQVLSDSQEENWWSVNHGDLVVLSSLFKLDNIYRNTSGGRELIEVIREAVMNIENDEIEEEENKTDSYVLEG